MKLAIIGHETRGKEVIELLKMLGGINAGACTGSNTNKKYVLVKGNIIDYVFHNDSTYDCITFTLEEFLEKFPYKVGDKVLLEDVVKVIKGAFWNGIDDEVVYKYPISYDTFPGVSCSS